MRRKVECSFRMMIVMAVLLMSAGCDRDFREYRDDDLGFSIKYPVGWLVQHIDQEGIAIHFEAPLEDDRDDFPENISVSAGDFVREVTPQEFSDLSMTVTRSFLKDVKVRKKGEYRKGKMKGFFIDYTGRDFQGKELFFHQVFFVKGKRLFSVIATLEEKNAGKYFSVIDKVVDSFRYE